VKKNAAYFGPPAGAAETQFVLQAVYAAIAGTKIAAGQPATEFVPKVL
jgi:hypothetical protein